MEGHEKKGFYAGVAALVILGIILIIFCVLCKVCLLSKRFTQTRWMDRLLRSAAEREKLKPKHRQSRDLQLVSEESQFMLNTQQGNYVGYAALERDVVIDKMTTVAQNSVNLRKQNGVKLTRPKSAPLEHTTSSLDELIDISSLKEKPLHSNQTKLGSPPSTQIQTTNNPDTADDKHFTSQLREEIECHAVPSSISAPAQKPRVTRRSITDYTIWEETSDLSGSEGVLELNEQQRSTSSDSDDTLAAEDCLEDSDTVRSLSSESFSSTINLLESLHDEASLGRIEYSLSYNQYKQQLVLQIIQAKNLELSASSGSGFYDCFVKAFTVNCSEKDLKKQTKLCKGTCDPVFKENFMYTISKSELSEANLIMQVLSRDSYARQKLIGECTINLKTLINLTSYRTWCMVTDYDHQPPLEFGELLIHLTLEDDSLKVNLSQLQLYQRLAGLSNSPYKFKNSTEPELFLTCSLINENGKPVSKQKTPSISYSHLLSRSETEHQKNTSNHLDKDISFNINSYSQFLEHKLVVELCRMKELHQVYETLAYTVLGHETTGTELAHWCYIYSRHSHSLSLNHKLLLVQSTSDRYIAPLILT